MPDKQRPASASQPEIVFSEAVRVEPKSFSLRKKAGTGGFDPKAIAAAEKRLADAKNMFPKIAAGDIDVISYAVSQLEHATQTKEWMERIQWAAAELMSNGTMFQYPLVGAVAQSLYNFMGKATNLSTLGREVILLHLHTLRVALEKGPRAITKEDQSELLDGLAKACAKAL